jgi:hypothetical protein
MRYVALFLGVALGLSYGATCRAYEIRHTSGVGKGADCHQLSRRLHNDFAEYRTGRRHKRGMTAELQVGITIASTGAKISGQSFKSKRPSSLSAFRRKQAQIIARMQRAGCVKVGLRGNIETLADMFIDPQSVDLIYEAIQRGTRPNLGEAARRSVLQSGVSFAALARCERLCARLRDLRSKSAIPPNKNITARTARTIKIT